MTSSHNSRCYVIFPGVVLTEDVYIFKFAKNIYFVALSSDCILWKDSKDFSALFRTCNLQ